MSSPAGWLDFGSAACACLGTGWLPAPEDELTYVVRCAACVRFPDEHAAHEFAYAQARAGDARALAVFAERIAWDDAWQKRQEEFWR